MKKTYTALFMLSITAVLMVITALLFIKNESFQKHEAAVPASVEQSATTTDTAVPQEATTTPTVAATMVEELTDDKGELIEVKRLAGGVTHEVRKEVAVRRFTHSSGAVATLYRKDEFYNADGAKSHSEVLKVKGVDGQETVVFSFDPTPDNLYFSRSVASVDFSPRGTYAVVKVMGYESYWVMTYETKTGAEVSNPAVLTSRYETPYWNADESKLVVVLSVAPIDGTQAALYYSKTGLFADLVPVTQAGVEYHENFIDEVKVEGNTLTARVTSNEWEEAKAGMLTFDMQSGTFAASPLIVW